MTRLRWQTEVNWRNWKVTSCLLNFAMWWCYVARQWERVEHKGVLDARLVNLLSFCVSPVGKCLRAPWFASVGFKQPIILWKRSRGCGTTNRSTGTTSATAIATFCFLLLGQWFSLQSWGVLWSRGSAEGLVLPPSDGQEVNNSWVYKGSTKTSNLL